MLSFGAWLVGLATGLMTWAMVENHVALLWIVFPVQAAGLIIMRYAERKQLP